MAKDDALRRQVAELLASEDAHLGFEKILGDVLPRLRGRRVRGLTHTPWRLLEHIRLAQRDILEFVRDPGHVSPKWPESYWPPTDGPPDDSAWDVSVAGFLRDRKELADLVLDVKRNLVDPLPWDPEAS